MDRDNLLELIDTIYAAGLEPTLWPDVLAQLADATGASDAALGILGHKAAPIIIAPRTDPDFARSYQRHYHPLNLFWRAVAAQPIGRVVTSDRVLSRERLHASEFFNDWSLPQNYRSAMGTTLVRSDAGSIELQLPGSHAFEDAEIDLVTRLVPHITRAAQLTQLLASARLQQQGFLDALDAIDQGVLVLDDLLSLLHANATAEGHLHGADGLSIISGRIVAKDAAENRKLQAVLGACTRAGGGGTLRISRADSAPLTLTVTPLPHDSAFALPQGRILVTVTDPERRSRAQALQVQRRYGLTGAELALLLEIAKGEGRKTAASRRGITVATARTQLSSIFDKTGVRRQAELVRLLHE